MIHSIKAQGVVLKRTNFGEADRILTIFSKEQGKIKVLAKGIRKITSRRSGNVEIFNLTAFSLYQGKSFLILTEAKTVNSFPDLRKNLKLVALAYHICELVDRLTGEHQENKEIFDLVSCVLGKLDNVINLLPGEKNNLIRNFETDLLKALGFLSREEVKKDFDTRAYIEELLENELNSKKFVIHLMEKDHKAQNDLRNKNDA